MSYRWSSFSFQELQKTSSLVSPNKKNDLSIKLLSWLVFMTGQTTHNTLKQYVDTFLKHIHGLVLVTNVKHSNAIVGYCYKAKYMSSHPMYQPVVLYDLKDASLTDTFLNYCETVLHQEYPGGVRYITDISTLTHPSLPSASSNIGAHLSEPRHKSPSSQMVECMQTARRYNLVFKPFTSQKRLGYGPCVSLCINTPMQHEIGYIPYNPKNKTIGSVSSLESTISPTLLECYAHNIVGKLYPRPPPQAKSLGVLTKREKHMFTVRLNITYQPLLAGNGVETPHSIHIYPTQGFFIGKQPLAVDTTILNSEEHQDSNSVSFTIDKTFSVATPFIPRTAALNFDVYALYINECDQKCINQAGFVSIPFSKLLSNAPITSTLSVPASDRPSDKGSLTVELVDCNMSLKVLSHRHPIQDLASKMHLIYAYIERNRDFYHNHPASNSAIERVTVFSYQTRTLFIPGCLFDVFNLPHTKEDYFINALLIAYHRRLVLSNPRSTPPFDAAQLTDQWIHNTSQKDKVLTVMDMLTIFVNYCTYQTDEVDRNVDLKRWRRDDAPAANNKTWRKEKVERIDSFDDIIPRMNGDCEDFSMEMLREVMQLKYNGHAYTSEIIAKHVVPILNDFVFVSGLAAVTAKSINEALSDGSIGGHECVYAIPNYIFFKALSRNKNNNPSHIHLYDVDERMAGHDEQEHIYILEGTGNLFPEPRSKTHRWSTMETTIVNFDTDDTLSKIFTDYYFYDPDANDNFYKMIITLITPEFYYRWGIPIFEFLVVKQSTYMGQLTFNRGVSFNELLKIDDNPSISIVACPEIPSDVLQLSLAIHENDYPPSPLIKLSPSQEIIDYAKKINYDTHPSSSSSHHQEKSAFSFQIRFKDMTKKIKQLLLNIAQETGFSLRCEPEFVHRSDLYPDDICGGYNIYFY